MAVSRFQFAFKALRQLGFTQVTLYALYKLGLKTGQFKLLTETHRLQTEIDGVPVSVIGLEDLKANKRASGRNKDLADLDYLP